MGSLAHEMDRLGKSTEVGQRQIPILSAMPAPNTVDPDVVDRCENALDAVRLCIHLSNFSHERICDAPGIDRGHWSRMMQGRAHFPTNKLVDLQRLCGNTAPTQYLASQFGWQLAERRKQIVERAA